VCICASEENLGYWSAIKWVLEHLSELASFSCDFLYTIQSDLIHADLAPPAMCERFLDSKPKASSVEPNNFWSGSVGVSTSACASYRFMWIVPKYRLGML